MVAKEIYHNNGPLDRYAKLRVAHAPGMPGTFSPPPPFSDPDMHHGTCVTHVPWCMPGSLTSGWFHLKSVAGKTFPAFPAHAQPAISHVWQEVYATDKWCRTGSYPKRYEISERESSHLSTVHAWSWHQICTHYSFGGRHARRFVVIFKATLTVNYSDVIMGAMESQITSLTIVYSTVYSGADQRKHQRSASLAFVGELTCDRWIPRTKGQLRGDVSFWWRHQRDYRQMYLYSNI